MLVYSRATDTHASAEQQAVLRARYAAQPLATNEGKAPAASQGRRELGAATALCALPRGWLRVFGPLLQPGLKREALDARRHRELDHHGVPGYEREV